MSWTKETAALDGRRNVAIVSGQCGRKGFLGVCAKFNDLLLLDRKQRGVAAWAAVDVH